MDLRTGRFLNMLYGFVGPLNAAQQDQVCKHISTFAKNCIANEDGRLLDEALEYANVRMLHEYVLVALIRLTSIYSDHLPHFSRVVNLGANELLKAGIDVEEALRPFDGGTIIE
jgi:hypothetical protein